jgi:hypothetical protein
MKSLRGEGWKPDRRSPWHELAGTLMWLLVTGLLYLYDQQIASILLVCVSAHLFLDFVSSSSQPYRWLRKSGRIDFRIPSRVGLIQELSTAVLFLWMFLRR